MVTVTLWERLTPRKVVIFKPHRYFQPKGTSYSVTVKTGVTDTTGILPQHPKYLELQRLGYEIIIQHVFGDFDTLLEIYDQNHGRPIEIETLDPSMNLNTFVVLS